MRSTSGNAGRHEDVLKSLAQFSKEHRAARWAGTFASFLESVFPADARSIARTSHQYIWDMMRAEGFEEASGRLRCQLFEDELYGINDTIERVVDYFKAAAAGSEVGRRLLLAARAALRRQVEHGDPAQARPGGVQPHRRRRALRHPRLPGARVAAAPRAAHAARRSSAPPTGSTSPASSARSAPRACTTSSPATSCRCRCSASSSRRPAASASAPTRRTTRPPPTSPTWSARWTCRRSPSSATRAIRAPGRGRARCSPRAAGCSR